MLDVIAELRKVCRLARIEGDRHRSEIAAIVKKADSAIGGFERGDRSPPLDDVSRYVAAYSEVIGIPELELWELALESARNKVSEDAGSDFDPDAAIANALAAARRADRSRAAQERAGSKPGRSSKSGSPKRARR